MKFSQERKNTIKMYLLEKIAAGDERITKIVADAFGITRNTVNTYLNELIEQNIIEKKQRDVYKLIKKEYRYELKRSEGQLDNDTYAYVHCLEPHINDLADNILRIWDYALSEMFNNVIDHSAAELLTLVVQRDYSSTTVYLWDNGVGIFDKIKNHFNLPSLDEAICELVKGKLTTDSQNHSGEGIFFTSKLMDRFHIISGKKIFTTDKYEDEHITTAKEEITSGTMVIMTLSNFSNKKASEVFDAYSDVDDGFTKTRITLKNIFPDAPVSRSQAKRVCNRLDSFKEVVLDFESLQWMGQGFAHQVFVVFQNQHPDIKLIPVNMSESVTKMYNHVTSE